MDNNEKILWNLNTIFSMICSPNFLLMSFVTWKFVLLFWRGNGLLFLTGSICVNNMISRDNTWGDFYDLFLIYCLQQFRMLDTFIKMLKKPTRQISNDIYIYSHCIYLNALCGSLPRFAALLL